MLVFVREHESGSDAAKEALSALRNPPDQLTGALVEREVICAYDDSGEVWYFRRLSAETTGRILSMVDESGDFTQTWYNLDGKRTTATKAYF